MRSATDWRCAASLSLLMLVTGCVRVAEPEAGPAPAIVAPTSTPAPPPAPVRRELVLSGAAEQGAIVTGRVSAGVRSLMLDGKPVPVAPDGGFLIGFDRDARAEAELVAVFADRQRIVRSIAVAAGRWRLEHINAPYRGSASSDADFARRRPVELAAIAAARSKEVESDGWRQGFRWPITGRLSGFFGAQRIYQGKPGAYHSGTDIAAPAGTPFVAPADGVVTLAAETPFTLEGHLLIVDHGMGLSSAFLHCQRLDVKVGDRVVQGQRLGTVGRTGRATGPHMHWGLTWRGWRLDPGKLAGPIGG